MTATVSRPTADRRTVPASPGAAPSKLAPLLERLNRQSVAKHHDAYVDIDWDDPNLAIGPGDPRISLFEFDPLGATDWYRAQDDATRSIIALHRTASVMKVGMQFENLLQRGLLSYAMRMDNGDPEFRYCHHEVIEESQHSLMFQELVNRTGLPVAGMPRSIRLLATVAVPVINRFAPELFFMMVLGGEDPVDYLQRRQLREGVSHPLLERIMSIHVTEEARHIAYARTFLKERVPALGPARRHALALGVPLVLHIMAPLMVDPTAELHTVHGVPKSVLRDARTSPAGRLLRKEAVAKQRRLCRELGLMTRPARRVWRAFDLYQRDGAQPSGTVPADAK